MPETAGELVASSGEVIGRHDGISSFTVGQRKGLGVSSPTPLYVLAIHPDSHRVTVGADAELATRTLRARRLNWISIPSLTQPMRVQIKIRHRHEPAWATLEPASASTLDAPVHRTWGPGRPIHPAPKKSSPPSTSRSAPSPPASRPSSTTTTR